MTFISYAQNFEDIILWRALKHVEVGYYIDVGAWDPRQDSVTLAFYERGWSGLNIEPDPIMVAKLQAARPLDLTLGLALSDTPGERPFYSFPETGWSTLSPAIAREHREAGWAMQEYKVRLARLSEVCDLHAPADIHFLKIDVEGAEAAVLAGADFKRHRPWIIVVEATAPNSPLENHLAWENLLLQAGYQPAYFDGLNRYYVADEKAAELLPHFGKPANVFDDFVSISSVRRALVALKAGEPIHELAEELSHAHEQEAEAQAQTLALTEARVKQAELAVLEARMQARLAEADAALPPEARPPSPLPEGLDGTPEQPFSLQQRRVFYDAGLILRFGFNPPVGIVRVEQYVAELLSRDRSILLRFVIFDDADRAYRTLRSDERTLLHNILFNRYSEHIVSDPMPDMGEMPPDDTLRLLDATPAPQAPDPAEEGIEPPCEEAQPVRRNLLGKLATSARTPRELFNEILSKDLTRMLPVRPEYSPVRRLSTRILRRSLAGGARAMHLALYNAAAPVRAGTRFASYLTRTDVLPMEPAADRAKPPTPEAVAERAGEAIAGFVAQEMARMPTEATPEMVSNAVLQLMPEMVAEARAQMVLEPDPQEEMPGAYRFQPGDTVITISNTWDYMDYGYLTRIVRQGKVRLISVIYDVIAMEMPYTTPAPIHIYHRHWIELGHLATKLVAISRHSEERYRRFIGVPNDLDPPMTYAYLPNFLYERREEIGETPVSELLGRRFVVFCSTIETRKNHQLLLHAWDRLREEIDPEQLPVLVFVGQWGWGTETVRLLSERNWRLRDHLRILNAISDAELIWLYRNTSFTVFPALSEGFGLAAAESLSFGTPVVVANCPALIEASEALMPAHDPLDLMSWIAELRRLILDADYLAALREKAATYRGAGYEDFAHAIRDAILAGEEAPAVAAEETTRA
jgi:FkbM family methyltransferase